MTHQTNPPERSSCFARRTFLATLGGASISLAGCTTRSNSADSEPSSDEVFDAIQIDGGRLRVIVASDVSADWIHRYGPDGSLADKTKVAIDGRDAWFHLVGEHADGYTPGSHRIVAVEDDESLGEELIDLQPDVSLTDFRWAKHYPEMEWEKFKNNWDTNAAFTLKNTGSGPALLSKTRWRKAPFVFRSDEKEKVFERSVPIPPHSTTTVYAVPPVYETSGGFFDASAVECGNLDRETLQLTGALEPSAEVSFNQTIEYGGERGACELTVVDSTVEQSITMPTRRDG